HSYAEPGWMDDTALAEGFRTDHLGRAPAQVDEAQLRHWQREAITRASAAELQEWLGPRLGAIAGPAREVFLATVRGNLLLPGDVTPLVAVVTQPDVALSDEARAQVAEAGAEFFARAAELFVTLGSDFKAWARAVGETTGRKGAKLFMPLRAALTGATHGPELAPLVALMGPGHALHRLEGARDAAVRG
ncbi:MAG: glutamate--tRNA ligase, partial [Steroidobacteraceae bacterium]